MGTRPTGARSDRACSSGLLAVPRWRVRQAVALFYVLAGVFEARELELRNPILMKYPPILILALLISGKIAAQQVFQILSESTVQQRDGSTITFRQVVPPIIAPQAQAAAVAPVSRLTTAEAAALSQMPVKESKVMGISASVHANGFTVLRWTCGESQRLHAVSNVDFRYLEGVGSWETVVADYMLILSAGPDEQAMTDAEARAAQSLPVNGSASFALANGSGPASPADESALDAMESLLDYFDSHREELIKLQAQREADRAARELAERNAPPPQPRHSFVHFWPLQPAQREAIQAKTLQEAQRMVKGGQQQ